MPYVSFVERRGEARGKVLGESLGAALVLRSLLEERFGPLPLEVTERLGQADAQQIVAWSRRVLRAQSLADVFSEREG